MCVCVWYFDVDQIVARMIPAHVPHVFLIYFEHTHTHTYIWLKLFSRFQKWIWLFIENSYIEIIDYSEFDKIQKFQ